MLWAAIFGGLPLVIWLVLLFGRGMYWRARERDDLLDLPDDLARWAAVTAVVPARNEAADDRREDPQGDDKTISRVEIERPQRQVLARVQEHQEGREQQSD